MKKTYDKMTNYEKALYSLCKTHTGKMKGIWSISTSPLMNPHCMARRAKGDCICSDCYSCKMMKAYPTLSAKLMKNSIFYTSHALMPWEVPTFKTRYGRFESFGDLTNLLQVYNYMGIASAPENAKVNFGLWTKNVFLLVEYVKAGGVIPPNVVINISSVKKNHAITPEQLAKLRKYLPIDHVFTVYETEEDAKKAGVKINCGKKNCNSCGLCYNHNAIDYINELLKK